MTKLNGTKTLENLMRAFAGESQARNRYSIFANDAGKEGLRQIEAIFTETAENERVHAKIFYRHILKNLDAEFPAAVEITSAAYPVAEAKTLDNLKAGAAGENEEWTKVYPSFADVAEKEGFPEVAASFRLISKIEEKHEARFNKLIANLTNGEAFKKADKVQWVCRVCGHVHYGNSAPEKCPTCSHPQGYFQIYSENY